MQYVLITFKLTTSAFLREQLREQHELTQEIGNAITSMPITEPIDEDELETELAALEQEKLDEDMLKPGTMPVRLPNGPTGDSKSFNSFPISFLLDPNFLPCPFFSPSPTHLPYHFFTILRTPPKGELS